ncbi:unnamed protein product [Brugia timori]|uniref:Transmembrane protein n=1 Tax=Brugia timori TaxID=42155 RepID=A0A0R3R5J8_9BILA|nr:unnamed protein product [Brugia timori]
MDLYPKQLSQKSDEQFGHGYQSLSIGQVSYMHRLEISDDGVYQSSFGHHDRNRPLLQSVAIFISKQQKDQQQQSHIDSASIDQLEMSHRKDPTFQSFIDIYKISDNATEFASNFEQYFSSCLPAYIWIGLMFSLTLWGLMHVIVGKCHEIS